MVIRNGECGDWRLSDEDFLQTFQVPPERCGTLAQRNPLPHEDSVVFDAPTHAYFVEGVRVPISVTSFLHRLSPEFKPNNAVAAMMGAWGWSEQRHTFVNEDGDGDYKRH